MRQAPVPNPAWANEIIAGSWADIRDLAPQWLPQLDIVRSVGENGILAEAREYGCGQYGCVYPTVDPSVVMKITTDDTEAEFAEDLAPTLVRPVCADYYRVIRLHIKHKGDRVYLLWRQEAQLVGKLHEVVHDDYGPGVAEGIYELVYVQHASAQITYAIMKHQEREFLAMKDFVAGLMPQQLQTLKSGDLTRAVNEWVMAVADLAVCQVQYLAELFQGILEVYNVQHIFFGDLHDGNLGAVWRGDGADRKLHWVITDPGHVAVIK